MVGILAVAAKGWGLITAEGTKIPQTTSCGQKKKKRIKKVNSCSQKIDRKTGTKIWKNMYNLKNIVNPLNLTPIISNIHKYILPQMDHFTR